MMLRASNPDGAGGKGGLEPESLTAITDKTYELAKKEKLLDTETKFTYVNRTRAST